jgi:hypothetical protein
MPYGLADDAWPNEWSSALYILNARRTLYEVRHFTSTMADGETRGLCAGVRSTSRAWYTWLHAWIGARLAAVVHAPQRHCLPMAADHPR